ncbi:hypothetical protein B4U79_17664 [Dinothrombium tinctorium]|uniref:F-box domain-containing protein n=1 Tax=Dinothrombium tinctorium TaxID=1965070 RepID=A0A443R3K5_9ACAR|nr:hypothetical protein B4U79_17664 [Dinothrombium tinctorium]
MSEFCDSFADNVWIEIISFLAFKDVASLSRVSKRLNSLCKTQLKTRTVLVVSDLVVSSYEGCFYAIDDRLVFPKHVTINNTEAELLLNKALPLLPNLKTLCLDFVEDFTDDSLHLIADRLPNLRHLWLSCLSEVTDDGFAQLFRKLPNLETLGFQYYHGSYDLSCFKHAPPVKQLFIGIFDTNALPTFTENSKFMFQRLESSLEKLHYATLESEDTQQLFNFLQNYQRLNSLFLFYIMDLTNSRFDKLSNLNSLQELHLRLYEFNWEDGSVAFPVFSNVKTLSIETETFVASKMEQFLQNFPNLEIIGVKILDPYSEQSNFSQLVQLIANMHSLKEVTLCYTRQFNNENNLLGSLLANLSNLTKLRFGNIKKNMFVSIVNGLNEVLNNNAERIKSQVELFLEQHFGERENIELNSKINVRDYSSCFERFFNASLKAYQAYF